MSVRDHMLNCNHVVAWEDFSIIGRESNDYLLETKESLFIPFYVKRDDPSLNHNITNNHMSYYFSHLTRIIFVLKV